MSESGYGKIFSSADGINFRNTWHGFLDVTIHHRLLRSAYRTMDPEQADVFYIPYYAQMLCRCSRNRNGCFGSRILKDLYSNITELPYFAAGKPHFITLGMPEMFYGMAYVPKWLANVLHIVLEVAHKTRITNPKRWYYNTLVAPYQSFGHFTHADVTSYMNSIMNKPRPIHVFLAGASHGTDKGDSQALRNTVIRQMPMQMHHSYSTFFKLCKNCSDDVIMFTAYRTCVYIQAERIIGWMQNSVFCLQPPGDTATRKSFYDSIISGCIPVLFELPYIPTRVTYPFDTKIDYSKFTVMIPANKTFTEVLDPYRHDTDAVKQLQKNLARVAKYLQYNDISTQDVDVDAFHLLLDQVGEHFGFVDKSLLF